MRHFHYKQMQPLDIQTEPQLDARREHETHVNVGGMTCQNCVRHVREALEAVDGVASANVDLKNHRALIHWKSQVTPNPAALISAVVSAGYEAQETTATSDVGEAHPWSPLEGWRFNVVLGGAAFLIVVLGEHVLAFGQTAWFLWATFVLASAVQVLCGGRFYLGAWNQLKIGDSNMDTLVALGSTSAYGFSLWGFFSGTPQHLYFMESIAIITLISAGHWMESLVSARAGAALRKLLNLAPPIARRLDDKDQEQVIPVSELMTGERILLKPGDRVPVDAQIIDGSSAVDESMLTGESMPVEKTVDSAIYAGTVNQNGRLVARVSGMGQTTALAQIIAAVERAQNSRAKIQKLADRVSSVFVPIVVVIAFATALFWGLWNEKAMAAHAWLAPHLWHMHLPEGALAAAFIHLAGVLIVACPCAMGLATPAAIMAGANAAAERGILIRDGKALEKSGAITTVLFDKTGTLTQGRLSIAASECLEIETTEVPSVSELAAALGSPSQHPLSQAIAQSAHSLIRLENWREIKGDGVMATMAEPGPLNGVALRLGSLRWLAETGTNTDGAERFVNTWATQGATILGLSIADQLFGLIALKDTIKPSTPEVIQRLMKMGKQIYMVTGDNASTAKAIAAQAGIPENHVFAETRPGQKAEIVRQLQSQNHRVAFVGDGINDAPALVQADLGIAVTLASDIARESADILLLKSDIHAVPEALALAQATLRVIKQNLFWAFFYNAAAIPLAALGFLSPILCALAMGVSDVIVIGNALRLRHMCHQDH
jgi:P-type Cu+ transporter